MSRLTEMLIVVLLTPGGDKEAHWTKGWLKGWRLPFWVTWPRPKFLKTFLRWLEKVGWAEIIYLNQVKPEGELLVEMAVNTFDRYRRSEEKILVIPDSYSPHRSRSVGQLYKDNLIAKGIPAERVVIVGPDAVETRGKSQAVVDYLKTKGDFGFNIKLPVSFYYSRRALREMDRALLGSEIKYFVNVISIVPCPFGGNWKKFFRLLKSEYIFNILTEPFKRLSMPQSPEAREKMIRKERKRREK